MKLINNRYQVLKTLENNHVVSRYLVNDIWNEYQQIELQLVNGEFVPSSLMEFYSKEFINLTNLKNASLIENYSFNAVININEKRDQGEGFFFTSQYIREKINLLEYIKDMKLEETIDVFMEICKAVNYLHLSGYTYGSLNMKNIFVSKEDNNKVIKLKDLATIKLEESYITESDISEEFFKSSRSLSKNLKDRSKDIFSLAVILLSMLKKKNIYNMPKTEVNIFKEFLNSNKNKFYSKEEVVKINEIILLITNVLGKANNYNVIWELVVEINKILEKDYNIIPIKELNNINFHTGIIGRKEELETVINSYDQLMQFKPSHKIFLVEGDIGTGKSRLLEELKFQFQFKKSSIYFNFNLDKSNKDGYKLWSDILRDMVLESDRETIKEYKEELIKYIPNLDLERKSIKEDTGINEYKFINRLGGFISESVKDKPAVFIIDNIHFADEFTLDIFTYIYSELMSEKNIMMIFSYKKEEAENQAKFDDFISSLKRHRDSMTIQIEDFTLEETGQFLKSIMHMPYTPEKFAQKIHSKTYGNPRFILEIIKDLYNSGIIYINEKSGIWRIDLPEEDRTYDSLYIPDSILQASKNQIEKIKGNSLKVLQVIAILDFSVSINQLKQFLNISENEIISSINELLVSGIITRKINDKGYVYEINNNILKDVIYSDLEEKEKIKYHKIAVDYFKNQSNLEDISNLQNLIDHLQAAGLGEESKKYYLENANKMKELGKLKLEIDNLDKLISLLDHEDIEEKIEYLIRIGKSYLEIENSIKAMEYLNKAEELCHKVKSKKDILDIYISKVFVMNTDTSQDEVNNYIRQSEEILSKYYDLGSSLRLKIIYAIIYLNKNEIDKSTELLLEVIDKAGDGFDKSRAEVYRMLGYIYINKGMTEKSLEAYDKSLELAKKIKSIKLELKVLNNIGGIYLDIYNDEIKALEYFNKVKDISFQHGYISLEVVGLINISIIHGNNSRYEIAIEILKTALDKALSVQAHDFVYVIYNELYSFSLSNNNYSEAFKYYYLTKSEVEKPAGVGMEIIRYYSNSGKFFNEIGEFKQAYDFFEKGINYNKENTAIYSMQLGIFLNILELRFKDKKYHKENLKSINEILKIIDDQESNVQFLSETAEVLCEQGDISNAEKFIEKAEKYMDQSIKELNKAKFYYTKAIIYNDEETLDNLKKSLNFAKIENQKKLVAIINSKIGEYYFNKKEFFYAAKYYISAHQIFKELVLQIPDKYKMNFINNFNAFRPFNSLIKIRNLKNGKEENQEEDNKLGTNKLEKELQKFNYNIIGDFINDEGFMEFIKKDNLMKLSKGILDEGDVIAKLGNDDEENIKFILNYLSAISLASNSAIVSQGKKQELTIMIKGKEEPINLSNKYLFSRVKIRNKPLLISSNESIKLGVEENIWEGEIEACMCIPLMSDIEESVFLYLETDDLLNNFNEKYFNKVIKYINLLNILIEKLKLTRTAVIDPLTGVYTRKYLYDYLEETLMEASKGNESFSIIIYDLDRFKRINDKYGHQAGDEVLIKISEVVMKTLGRKKFLGRYGGEEFIIVLPKTNKDEALYIAQEVRRNIENERTIGEDVQITVSMGISSYPEHGRDIHSLIDNADKALYSAKKKGRNRCQVWNKEYTDKNKTKDSLSGILTGDDLKDSRNVLAIVELIQLVNKNIPRVEKIYNFLGRIIEMTEAKDGIIFTIENGKIIESFQRERHQKDLKEDLYYNKNILEQVICSKEGIVTIDWDYIKRQNLISGIPDWISIMVEPVVVEDKLVKVIYLSSFVKSKEFDLSDLNYVNTLANLIGKL